MGGLGPRDWLRPSPSVYRWTREWAAAAGNRCHCQLAVCSMARRQASGCPLLRTLGAPHFGQLQYHFLKYSIVYYTPVALCSAGAICVGYIGRAFGLPGRLGCWADRKTTGETVCRTGRFGVLPFDVSQAPCCCGPLWASLGAPLLPPTPLLWLLPLP